MYWSSLVKYNRDIVWCVNYVNFDFDWLLTKLSTAVAAAVQSTIRKLNQNLLIGSNLSALQCTITLFLEGEMWICMYVLS